MKLSVRVGWGAVAAVVAVLAGSALAADQAPKSLLVASGAGAEKQLAPSCAQVTAVVSKDDKAPGIAVTIQSGAEAWPGIRIQPEGKEWDLSAFGHVQARIVNMGGKPINVSLRVDNAGDWKDSPWNCESTYLKEGEAGTVTTIFGHSYGRKPGFALKPAAVVGVLIFCTKSDAAQSFRIESLEAAGPAGEKPPVDPELVRVKPEGGYLLGPGVTIDAAKEIKTKDATALLEGEAGKQTLKVTFPPEPAGMSTMGGDPGLSVTLKPAVGRWDLRDSLEVRVKVRNEGTTPVSVYAKVLSNGGQSDVKSTPDPLAAGAEGEFVVPFAAAAMWTGKPEGSGNRVTNDAVSAVVIFSSPAKGERVLRVESIRADRPALVLPDWLGKRPPPAATGEWAKTFDEEFDAPALDATKWNIYGENYWDKQSHFSKDNVILGDGVVRLRFAKKRGHQNDDPKHERVTDYASGFLDTYGKWTQRYGYFEARMKMPTAPGLWPAFWMMPDRGVALGEQWKRQETGNAGMELDILEYLTRWGPCRFNIAHHWDGYGKEHKANGSDRIYAQPDKDGFITAGLLWTPGVTAYYYNGLEVLRWENARVSTVPAIMMFTLPMGGWDNSPLDDARLPDDFVIDYVRVWQRKDLAGGGEDGKTR